MLRFAFALMAGMLLCAQTPIRGFPPGTFQSRAALDASGGGGGYTGPGDTASFTVWYGLRAYSAAKRGNAAINVCNVADAACADMSTDATTGKLVVTTIGGSDCSVVVCTVKKLYDQTQGSACQGATSCDLTQTTIATRPTLTTSCINTLPCLAFSGTQHIDTASNLAIAQPFTISYVAKHNNSGTFGLFVEAAGSGVLAGFSSTAGKLAENYGSLVQTNSATEAHFHAVQEVGSGASSSTMVDGTGPTTISAGTTAFSVILALGGTALPLTGNITETGVAASGISSGNQTTINGNQTTFWGPF